MLYEMYKEIRKYNVFYILLLVKLFLSLFKILDVMISLGCCFIYLKFLLVVIFFILRKEIIIFIM